MHNCAGLFVEPSATHHEWSRHLEGLSQAELREHVRLIRTGAGELGVWERGGYIPLQPFVVSAAANRLLHDVGRQLQDLLISHALDRAGGDLARLADIAEWPHDDRWFLGAKQPLAHAVGSRRADMFVADGRPQFLEFNFGTCLNGGVSSAVLSSTLLSTPLGSRLRSARAIGYGSFLDNLVRWVRRELPGNSPRVALLAVPSDGDEGSIRWAEHHQACFAAYGIPSDLVPISEAEVVDGALTWCGNRYQGAIRYFMVTPKVACHLGFIAAMEHAERTTLFGGYLSQLFTSKALLADLYQDDRLSADQRRLLDYIPWMARLREGPARRGEEQVDPVEWAQANREHAVLKPSNLFGSRGVVVGHLTPEADWRSALEAAVKAGGHVVQELVHPDAWQAMYWHIESESLVKVESPALLGPYVVDGADGGAYTRHPITGTEDDLLGGGHDISLGCVMSA